MWKKFLAAMFMVFAAAVAMAAVDVNKATEAELDAMKGIGPTTSKAILAERKKGDFKDWSDFIKRVKGVGEKKAEQFSKEGMTVNGEGYKTASASKSDKKADKASAKEEKKEAKAEKKEAKAEAKADKKEAKAEAKADKKEAKANSAKPAASGSRK
jgi:competence protein ComEA